MKEDRASFRRKEAKLARRGKKEEDGKQVALKLTIEDDGIFSHRGDNNFFD